MRSRFALLPALAFGFVALTAAAHADDKGTVVKLNKLSGTTPATWKSEKPANRLRSYQFKIPGADGAGEAELAVYPDINPDPEKNFPKWKATYIPPEGKTVDDVSKVSKLDHKAAKISVLDVTGTWKYKSAPQDPKAKEMLLDNYRTVWVIIAEKDEASYFRLAGPKVTVDKHYAEFEKWILGLK